MDQFYLFRYNTCDYDYDTYAGYNYDYNYHDDHDYAYNNYDIHGFGFIADKGRRTYRFADSTHTIFNYKIFLKNLTILRFGR